MPLWLRTTKQASSSSTDQGGGKRRVITSAAAMWARARASGCVASAVWAISRPLPGKHFLNEWNFSRGVVTQNGDHFLFADFVVGVVMIASSCSFVIMVFFLLGLDGATAVRQRRYVLAF
jgi:hypothetical protein